ncbi:MAG: hypothetical protein ABIN01_13995 [Ferruginibacter sp.]
MSQKKKRGGLFTPISPLKDGVFTVIYEVNIYKVYSIITNTISGHQLPKSYI